MSQRLLLRVQRLALRPQLQAWRPAFGAGFDVQAAPTSKYCRVELAGIPGIAGLPQARSGGMTSRNFTAFLDVLRAFPVHSYGDYAFVQTWKGRREFRHQGARVIKLLPASISVPFVVNNNGTRCLSALRPLPAFSTLVQPDRNSLFSTPCFSRRHRDKLYRCLILSSIARHFLLGSRFYREFQTPAGSVRSLPDRTRHALIGKSVLNAGNQLRLYSTRDAQFFLFFREFSMQRPSDAPEAAYADFL